MSTSLSEVKLESSEGHTTHDARQVTAHVLEAEVQKKGYLSAYH